MARYSDTLVDQNGRPVAGAVVTILTKDGTLAVLTNDASGPIANPFIVGDTGFFYFNAIDAVYDAQFRYGGRLIREDEIIVGEPPAFAGPTGPSNNTRLTLADLKAAATTDTTSLYDGSLWTWTAGDFTGQADNINIVQSDTVPINFGAWVRNSPRRSDLAASSGSSLVGFLQVGTGATAGVVQTELRYFIRPEQFGAVGDGVNDDTAAIVKADNFAALTGAVVIFAAKLYRTTAKISKSYKTWWEGSGNSFPVIAARAAVPSQRICGTQIFKDHNDDAVSMIGPGPYNQCGGITRIGVVSDSSLHPGGSGFVFDMLGSLRVTDCRVWNVGGDGFVFGASLGDVTGQFHISGLYVNNPAGACIRNRSKWLKMSKVETDGGQYSYYGNNSPNADIDQFHFEGASATAVVLAGANGNTRFRGGFVGMTNVSATLGFDIQSASGNTDVTIENVQLVGHSALTYGINLGASAQRSAIINCDISNCPTGVNDASDGTSILANSFLACGLPIREAGAHSVIEANRTVGTTGGWSIDHVDGDFGVWETNVLDTPIKPTKFGGIQGNFGTNRVANNSGFKTRASGVQTFSASTGGNIAHTLSVAPYRYQVDRLDGGPKPAGFTISSVDGTNIAISWTSSGTYQFGWEAEAVCEGA